MAFSKDELKARTFTKADMRDYAMRIATRAQERAEATDRRLVGLFGPNFRQAVIDEAEPILLAMVQHERNMHAVRSDAKRFTMYRRSVPDATHTADQKNPPDQPQFEGIVFSDGTVAIRWLTAKRSTAVWNSMEDMLAIHGHPEYGSEIVWHDGDAAGRVVE